MVDALAQEPMKDVGICDKPRGVDNQTVIRGISEWETRLEAVPGPRLNIGWLGGNVGK